MGLNNRCYHALGQTWLQRLARSGAIALASWVGWGAIARAMQLPPAGGLVPSADLAQGVDPLDDRPAPLPPAELPRRQTRLAPGVTLHQGMVGTAAANAQGPRFPTYWVEVAPRAAARLRPIVARPDGQTGTAPLAQTARAARAAVAINGGFFNRDRQLPLGAVKLGDRWLSGPILNRGAVAWDDAGTWRFNRLSLREVATVGGRALQLSHLNSGYVQAGIARYTRDWGASYTTLSDNEIGVVVVSETVNGQPRDRISAVIPAGTAGSQAFPLPARGYLLVVRSLPQVVPLLVVDAPVRLNRQTSPAEFDRLPFVVGGGPLLLRGGQEVLNAAGEQFQPGFVRQEAVRSAIARRADGTVLLATAHERPGGRGPSLAEWAQVLRSLGAIDALNLDGGSSTGLWVGERLVDRAPGTAARVHGGIGLFFPAGSPP